MKKILLCVVILCFSLQFAYASEGEDNGSKENKIKIEKLKQKKLKVKQKIADKFEKKLSQYDDLTYEEKEKIYNKLLEVIDKILEKEGVSKTEKILYSLFREIISDKKNNLNK